MRIVRWFFVLVVLLALGAGLATLWGWNLTSGIVFGFALSVAVAGTSSHSSLRFGDSPNA